MSAKNAGHAHAITLSAEISSTTFPTSTDSALPACCTGARKVTSRGNSAVYRSAISPSPTNAAPAITNATQPSNSPIQCRALNL